MPAKIAGRLRAVRPARPVPPLSAVVDVSPAAARAGRPTWADRRLWAGVLLVLLSLVAGSRVMASADDTVEVWAVSTDEGAGAVLTPHDLTLHRVHAEDAADLDPYFPADALPDRLVLRTPVGAGELLPRSAVGTASTGLVQLPVAVDPVQVPPSVGVGSVVDVYVVIPGVDAGRGPVLPAISGASVVAAPSVDSTFGASGQRQITIAVPEKEARAFYALLASADAPLVSVVGQP